MTTSPLLAPSQELLKDGKRETTISQLLINPTDLDIGRVFTCRSMNEAIPSGKETSIELDVHREQGSGAAGWRGAVGEGLQGPWKKHRRILQGPRTDAHFLNPAKISWFDPWALRTGEEASAIRQFPHSLNQCVALGGDLISLSLSFQFYICG